MPQFLAGSVQVGAGEGETQVPLLTWATLRVRVKALLNEAINKNDGQTRIQFIHGCVYEVSVDPPAVVFYTAGYNLLKYSCRG